MKKIILFVALATLGIALNACSSDDSGSSANESFITVKIDGIDTTFDNINVTEIDTNDVVILYVSATKGNNLSESITFSTATELIGSDNVWDFNYTKDNAYFEDTSNFFTQIITNSNGSLTGTFSGKLRTNGANPTEKTFTDGTFNIKY